MEMDGTRLKKTGWDETDKTSQFGQDGVRQDGTGKDRTGGDEAARRRDGVGNRSEPFQKPPKRDCDSAESKSRLHGFRRLTRRRDAGTESV